MCAESMAVLSVESFMIARHKTADNFAGGFSPQLNSAESSKLSFVLGKTRDT